MFRRLVALAGLGVTGVLLSQKTGLIPPVEAACTSGTICYTDSTTDGITIGGIADGSGMATGVYGNGAFAGVKGTSTTNGGIGIWGVAGVGGVIPIVAEGLESGQGANLQEWALGPNPVSVVNASGWLGVGTSSPARAIHLQNDNACFRMDRDVDSSAFILTRTAAGDFSTIWKTFYVGVNASGVNDGEFFIGDAGTAVSGASTMRLWIDNGGTVHIPSLSNGDMKFANDFTVTEDKNDGLAFLNPKGAKIAVLDSEGNFHIKGDIIKDL